MAILVRVAIANAEGGIDTQVASSKEIHSEVRIGSWYTTDTLDPCYVSIVEQSVIFDALFEGLVRHDEKGSIVPAQASSWIISPDGKRYEFQLREDIFWTDGKPVVAQDFVLAFRRIVDPAWEGNGRPNYLLTIVKNASEIMAGKMDVSTMGISAPDSKTLVIELTAPASYFLEILDYPSLVPVPSHVLEKYGKDWWLPERFVSNGPYKLVDLVRKQAVTIELHDKKTYPNAPDRVKFVATDDWASAFHQIVLGKLDMAWDLRRHEGDWMQGRIDLQDIVVIMPTTTYVTLNTKSAKLSDKRIRQAINLVTDRQGIANARFGSPAHTLAVPDMLKYSGSDLKELRPAQPYAQRVKKAQALMKEAGYGPENPIELEITTLDRTNLRTTATALRSMFSQIWVNAEINIMQLDPLTRRLNSDEFEVGLEYWSGDYNDGMTFYQLFQSGGTRNRPRFHNPQYEQLIEKALKEQDTKKRQEIYVQLEAILYEESPIIPLSHGNFRMIASSKIENSGIDPLFLAQIPRMLIRKPRSNLGMVHPPEYTASHNR